MNKKALGSFVQKALSDAPDEMPVRGPKVLEDGELKYENNWRGDIENFSGEEFIVKNGQQIYNAKYIGGFVDLRRE